MRRSTSTEASSSTHFIADAWQRHPAVGEIGLHARRVSLIIETMSAVLSIMPALAVVVAVIGLVRLMRETRNENRRQQQRATINYITSTVQRQHDLYGNIHQDQSFADKAAVIDSPEFHELTSYLGYLEYLAAGVNMGIFDAEVVSRTIGGRIVRANAMFGEWIHAERERLDNPGVYIELELLIPELRALREHRVARRASTQPEKHSTSRDLFARITRSARRLRSLVPPTSGRA